MEATYPLAMVHALLRTRQVRITGTAAAGARALGLDAIDLMGLVAALTPGDLHKTMPSERVPGLWQDVYRPTWEGLRLYVKLQIAQRRTGALLVIVSCKRR